MPVVCIVLAFFAARGAERPRIAWAGGSFVLLYLGFMFFQATANDDALKHYGDIVVDVAVFVAPLGLTYALLNRRLLDVGFALNRAVVFTTLSLVIVGAFTLAEWALGSWLQSATKATNLIVSAALALGLGLSIHPIHAWVDRFIDNVFFRKRHQDEKALRRFAHEAAFTTDPMVILERTKRELLEHAESEYADVLLYDGAGRYGDIDENDLALVALRASGERVDLHGLETVLHGDYAYPMLARGRFVGALVVGPKRSHEPYAPDESAAIAEVAHGVGIALDLLGVGRNDTTPAILDAIGALDRSINVLTAAVIDRRNAGREDGLIAG
jgi:sigma-B regulation protein RsbU (phosphoserine phosphatase)